MLRWLTPKDFLLAVILAGLSGCGTHPEDVRLPVEGEVTFNGKPLTTGVVIMRPDVAHGNTSQHEPRAKIDADGKYHVETALRSGAPPGWYKVGVVVTEPSDPTNPYSAPRSLIPEKFGNPDESGLSLEVRPNAPPGAYDIKLDTK